MNRWKPILAAALIFSTGVASGFFISRATRTPSTHSREPGGPPPPGEGRPDFTSRLKRDLALDEAQSQRVEAILQDGRKRNRQIWETVQPQMREEMKRVRELIQAELNPAQRTKYDEIMKQRSRDRERRGPRPEGPGGPGGPPGFGGPDGPGGPGADGGRHHSNRAPGNASSPAQTPPPEPRP